MAIRFDIGKDEFFFIGEDTVITIDVVADDGVTPQNMAGWSLAWELKPLPSTAVASANISKTVGSGITIGDGSATDDRATITIDDDDTEGLDAGVYYHQLRRTDAGAEVILTVGDALLRASGL